MKSIVLLSGPIGAGKTSVAKELVACSPAPVAYIEGDTFWSFFAKISSDPGHQKSFRTVMRSMVSAAVPFALSDYEVIVDFSIPPWFLDIARKVAAFREVPLHYVVLRPGEEVCAARAASRTEGTIPDYTQYRELYTSFDEAEQYILSDDVSEPAELAAHIRSGIDAGKFRVG